MFLENYKKLLFILYFVLLHLHFAMSDHRLQIYYYSLDKRGRDEKQIIALNPTHHEHFTWKPFFKALDEQSRKEARANKLRKEAYLYWLEKTRLQQETEARLLKIAEEKETNRILTKIAAQIAKTKVSNAPNPDANSFVPAPQPAPNPVPSTLNPLVKPFVPEM